MVPFNLVQGVLRMYSKSYGGCWIPVFRYGDSFCYCSLTSQVMKLLLRLAATLSSRRVHCNVIILQSHGTRDRVTVKAG